MHARLHPGLGIEGSRDTRVSAIGLLAEKQRRAIGSGLNLGRIENAGARLGGLQGG